MGVLRNTTGERRADPPAVGGTRLQRVYAQEHHAIQILIGMNMYRFESRLSYWYKIDQHHLGYERDWGIHLEALLRL